MSEKTKLLSLEQLKKLRKPLKNVNKVHEASLSLLSRIAVKITDHVGSMGFFFIIFVWTLFWLSWNAVGIEQYRFDPYPAFVLWLFISNVIQIFLMPLIMIGQNLQGQHSEKRAEADYEVNLRAEREIETILAHLESQNEMILKILKHLESKKN